MSNSSEVKIVNPELSLNKKLAGITFDQAFGTGQIQKAEMVVVNSKPVFKDETLSDFADLKEYFNEIPKDEINAEIYRQISKLSFSIKSRAATGGYPLASEIGNSLFKFCDAAAEVLPANGYKILKLHFDSLSQSLENPAAFSDNEKARKLINGLEEVSRKYLKND